MFVCVSGWVWVGVSVGDGCMRVCRLVGGTVWRRRVGVKEVVGGCGYGWVWVWVGV